MGVFLGGVSLRFSPLLCIFSYLWVIESRNLALGYVLGVFVLFLASVL